MDARRLAEGRRLGGIVAIARDFATKVQTVVGTKHHGDRDWQGLAAALPRPRSKRSPPQPAGRDAGSPEGSQEKAATPRRRAVRPPPLHRRHRCRPKWSCASPAREEVASKSSTHRRRLDATANNPVTAHAAGGQEAKVATLEKAKAKTDVSGAASARALSARLRAVEQRVAEQSEHAQHAEEQSTRLHGALARLATMQRKQEQLGREQQMLASRLQSLPSELSELAEPSIRPSSAPVERRSAPPPRQQPPPRQPPPPPRQSPPVPPRAAACPAAPAHR